MRIKTEDQRKHEVSSETSDPVLMMLAVGKQLWEQESGDSLVERLRSEEAPIGGSLTIGNKDWQRKPGAES
jgi:hypothetical protein